MILVKLWKFSHFKLHRILKFECTIIIIIIFFECTIFKCCMYHTCTSLFPYKNNNNNKNNKNKNKKERWGAQANPQLLPQYYPCDVIIYKL